LEFLDLDIVKALKDTKTLNWADYSLI